MDGGGKFFFLRFFLEHLGFFWNWGSVFCWGSDGGGEFFFLEFFFWNNTLVFFLAGTKGGGFGEMVLSFFCCESWGWLNGCAILPKERI